MRAEIPGTHADLASNDRELIVLRQAKGSCRYCHGGYQPRHREPLVRQQPLGL